jgi:hypothetical protein
MLYDESIEGQPFVTLLHIYISSLWVRNLLVSKDPHFGHNYTSLNRIEGNESGLRPDQ